MANPIANAILAASRGGLSTGGKAGGGPGPRAAGLRRAGNILRFAVIWSRLHKHSFVEMGSHTRLGRA